MSLAHVDHDCWVDLSPLGKQAFNLTMEAMNYGRDIVNEEGEVRALRRILQCH